MRFQTRLFGLVVGACFAVSTAVMAQTSANEQELQAAKVAASQAAVAGPHEVILTDQASLALPSGFSYIPPAQASRLMHAMGNQTGSDFQGLIFGERLQGFVTINYVKSGYIKDDDARDWDADELLKNLKEGTEAGNEDRRQRGLPEFSVVGWVEPPSYEAQTHRLVWSAELRDKDDKDAGAKAGVNYNTYLLGREGYVSMNLVTALAVVEAQKPVARELLGVLSFNEGKRYADFNANTDQVAAYGLAALVGGVAAKKLGLLATLGVFLAKFWKVALLAVAGFGAVVRKWFSGRKG